MKRTIKVQFGNCIYDAILIAGKFNGEFNEDIELTHNGKPVIDKQVKQVIETVLYNHEWKTIKNGSTIIVPLPHIIVQKKLTMDKFRKVMCGATEATFVSPNLYYISDIMLQDITIDVFESLFTKQVQKYLNDMGAELCEVIPYKVIDSKLQVYLKIECIEWN